jgi:hypothetical protein
MPQRIEKGDHLCRARSSISGCASEGSLKLHHDHIDEDEVNFLSRTELGRVLLKARQEFLAAEDHFSIGTALNARFAKGAVTGASKLKAAPPSCQ